MVLVFGVGMGGDDDARSVATVVLHYLERVDGNERHGHALDDCNPKRIYPVPIG